MLRPPNGEDLLYVFRARVEGRSLFLPYNTMRKAVATPLPCHGHALLDDGTLLVLRAGSDQAARVHPIQRWHSPHVADNYAAARPVGASAPALIGSAELVRGISNCRPVARSVTDMTTPTTGVYETLLAAFARATDQHHRRDRAEVGDPLRPLGEVRRQGSGSWLSGGGTA
ncbi:DNA repair ATPase [Streptomyces hundungensis]|uniref:DNA repair ATPase n=1 Tax=Streptomyces hundungensis TaxID=1077946 RepID=UPI0033DB5439